MTAHAKDTICPGCERRIHGDLDLDGDVGVDNKDRTWHHACLITLPHEVAVELGFG